MSEEYSFDMIKMKKKFQRSTINALFFLISLKKKYISKKCLQKYSFLYKKFCNVF